MSRVPMIRDDQYLYGGRDSNPTYIYPKSKRLEQQSRDKSSSERKFHLVKDKRNNPLGKHLENYINMNIDNDRTLEDHQKVRYHKIYREKGESMFDKVDDLVKYGKPIQAYSNVPHKTVWDYTEYLKDVTKKNEQKQKQFNSDMWNNEMNAVFRNFAPNEFVSGVTGAREIPSGTIENDMIPVGRAVAPAGGDVTVAGEGRARVGRPKGSKNFSKINVGGVEYKATRSRSEKPRGGDLPNQETSIGL